MRTRRIRNPYVPSSSAKLAFFVSTMEKAARNERNIRRMLEAHRDQVTELAGPAGAEWAISQLTTDPHFVKGWPAPCKAARMRVRIRKAAR